MRPLLLVPLLAACLQGTPARAAPEEAGLLAAHEMRHLAATFPGRSVGTQRAGAAAEYLARRLTQMGYVVERQAFDSSYTVEKPGAEKLSQPAEGINLIARRPGGSGPVVLVGAHYDSRPVRKADDARQHIGGAALAGLDDNASGVGVALALAERLAAKPLQHEVRFVLFSGVEVGLKGSRAYVDSLAAEERARVRLMINLDSLITGDRLYFHAGPKTVSANPAAGFARDMALEIARARHIKAETNPGLNPKYPAGTGCCSDLEPFDEAGIPVLAVEATNWTLGERDGYTQTDRPGIPGGMSWHKTDVDKAEVIDRVLPGRVEQRAREVTEVLGTLLERLARPAKGQGAPDF